jgi:hypothetical protein
MKKTTWDDFDGLEVSASEINGSVANVKDDRFGFDKGYINIFDLSLYPKSGVSKVLTLPNPYPDKTNAPVHTSIVKSPTTFNGYKFWIAYTPYPNANSDYENPCVVATNNFENFVEPATNPIVGKPTIGYNADTHLVFSPDYNRLYLLYRSRGGGLNTLKIMHTEDGKTWSEPITLFSGSLGTDFASPSAWWNGTSWVITYHNLDASTPWPIYRVVSNSSDIYGTYSSPLLVNAPTSPNGLNLGWWHSYFENVGNGQIVGLVQDNTGAGGSGDLYSIQSFDDGLNFELNPKKIVRSQGFYRSTFYRDGNSIVFIPTTLSGIPTIYRAEMGYIKDLNEFRNKRKTYLSPASSIFPEDTIVVDSFTRADSSTLGTSETGQTWTVVGTGYEVKDNKAYALGVNSKVIIDTTYKNFKFSAKITMTASVQQWLMCKYIDSSNYIRVGFTSGTTSIIGAEVSYQEVVAGAIPKNISTGKRVLNNEVLEISCVGNVLTIYINNEIIFTTIMSLLYKNATKIGLQSNQGATSSFDDVIVIKQD